MRTVKIYTKTGDDGTTGMYFGGRVPKSDPAPAAYGAVDEAQADLGVARAEIAPETYGELAADIIAVQRDLWVLMAELATEEHNRHKLESGRTLVTADMVIALEAMIDRYAAQYPMPTEFVVPGESRLAALLDVARTTVRRAERDSVQAVAPDSQVLQYLNRLSDLVWTWARFVDASASGGYRLARDS